MFIPLVRDRKNNVQPVRLLVSPVPGFSVKKTTQTSTVASNLTSADTDVSFLPSRSSERTPLFFNKALVHLSEDKQWEPNLETRPAFEMERNGMKIVLCDHAEANHKLVRVLDVDERAGAADWRIVRINKTYLNQWKPFSISIFETHHYLGSGFTAVDIADENLQPCGVFFVKHDSFFFGVLPSNKIRR